MKASTQENIAAAIFCVCLLGFLTVAASSWTRAYDRASFRKLAGISMEDILSAKAKCEAINGVGNCQLTGGYGNKNNASFDDAMAVMPEDRNKRSVWDIPTESFKGAHFATFPRALVRPCILAGSRPGDLVLDPFGGSGTTAAVAEELAREWVICELNQKYADIAHDRIGNTHPGLAL